MLDIFLDTFQEETPVEFLEQDLRNSCKNIRVNLSKISLKVLFGGPEEMIGLYSGRFFRRNSSPLELSQKFQLEFVGEFLGGFPKKNPRVNVSPGVKKRKKKQQCFVLTISTYAPQFPK